MEKPAVDFAPRTREQEFVDMIHEVIALILGE